MAPGPAFRYSYTELFNLDDLKSFKLPEDEGGTANHVSSSHGENNGEREDGDMKAIGRKPPETESSLITKGKREQFEACQPPYNSPTPTTDAGKDDGNSERRLDCGITEEQYRNMLTEHVEKKQKMAAAEARPKKAPARLKEAKNARRRKPSLASQAGPSTELLEMGNGIVFAIPPTYDVLAKSVNLPNFSDVRIDGCFMNDVLDFKCLDAMVAADRRRATDHSGGRPALMYASLLDRLNQACSASNSIQFNLRVADSDNEETMLTQDFEFHPPPMEHEPVKEKYFSLERMTMHETDQLQPNINVEAMLMPAFESHPPSMEHEAMKEKPFCLNWTTIHETESHPPPMEHEAMKEKPFCGLNWMTLHETESHPPPMEHEAMKAKPFRLNRMTMHETESHPPPMEHEAIKEKTFSLHKMTETESHPPPMEHEAMKEKPLGLDRMTMHETDQLQPNSNMEVLEEVNGCYRIIEWKVPKRQKRIPEDDANQKFRKLWEKIVKKDIPKQLRNFQLHHHKKTVISKKLTECCQKEFKIRTTRSLKLMKSAKMRIKKLARDMVLYYKRLDKEQADIRKHEEKEAAEAQKREQAEMEQKRQQRSLNFLLSQSQLYAHFMQPKQGDAASTSEANLREEKDREDVAMKEEAVRAAMEAANKQKKITSEIDNECESFRVSQGSSSNMDLVNPSSMPLTSSVQTPNMLQANLTGYQLKGLQWLVNCYEMSVNGILADEMGLGKTVQAISLMAHLAEEKNIWGPFLVVAPTTVAPNWVDEMAKFCPDLKTFPYWSSERKVLRNIISPRNLYRKESDLHVLITSYQILVSDEKYFRPVKWQYIILDEAQAIKSSNSQRWKTVMTFKCRNRVLLTGTPIQNNMAELWALLHFIMPTLFDRVEQFKEWFSKDIENDAERGNLLNEHNLKKLHDVLKPFMLRRLKKDVIGDLPGKKEVCVNCKLSSRQQDFYHAIRNKLSIAELFDCNCLEVHYLMNIVMQLRKVCNHPELFQRNEGHTTMYFGEIHNSLLPPCFGELGEIHYAGSRNPISYNIPKLVYRECSERQPISSSGSAQGFQQKWLHNLLNIFSTENVHRSVFPESKKESESVFRSGTFGFSRMVDLSPGEVAFLAKGSHVEQWLFSLMIDQSPSEIQFIPAGPFVKLLEEEDRLSYDEMEEGKVRVVKNLLMLPPRPVDSALFRKRFPHGLSEALVVPPSYRFLRNAREIRSIYSFIPVVSAPPLDVACSDRSFSYQRTEEQHHPWLKRLLVGFARTSEFNGPAKPDEPHLIQEIDAELPVQQPLLQLTHRILGTSPRLQTFDLPKILRDSGKMQTLDALLKRLRAENHRVLLFAQMTKMLNILEDYVNYRKYKYLRLDGSSTVRERHHMVKNFQTKTDIFVFLLSTRAGGVGINLTAADTVIFYESDWNPKQDKQAMDRSHRIGQIKEVTVYRLICKGTIEEKILQIASKKSTVQQLVMTGRQAHGNEIAAGDALSLFVDNDDDPQLQKITELGKDKLKINKSLRFDENGNDCIKDMDGEKGGELQNGKTTDRKRKGNVEKRGPSKPPKMRKTVKNSETFTEPKDAVKIVEEPSK